MNFNDFISRQNLSRTAIACFAFVIAATFMYAAAFIYLNNLLKDYRIVIIDNPDMNIQDVQLVYADNNLHEPVSGMERITFVIKGHGETIDLKVNTQTSSHTESIYVPATYQKLHITPGEKIGFQYENISVPEMLYYYQMKETIVKEFQPTRNGR